MLTSEEIRFMRSNYSHKSDDGLQMDIDLYKSYIANYTGAIAKWKDYINLMQTMLNERTI